MQRTNFDLLSPTISTMGALGHRVGDTTATYTMQSGSSIGAGGTHVHHAI